MANPLPPAIHRHADQELDFRHFKRRGVPVPQQIANQPPIVGNFARSFAVTDPRGLDDRLIVPHHVDQADKTIVEHRKFLPAQFIGNGSIRRHGDGFSVRGSGFSV